jgi:hypothetical protein
VIRVHACLYCPGVRPGSLLSTAHARSRGLFFSTACQQQWQSRAIQPCILKNPGLAFVSVPMIVAARHCLRHALTKLPKKLMAIASPVRLALCPQFHTLLYRARQRQGLRVFALGQRLRHLADHVAHRAGVGNGARRPADARDQHPRRPSP